MTATSKQGFVAQILVGVVTGLVIGLLTGSGTAYVLVSELDHKLEQQIIAASSTDAQIRRDIARLEQSNLSRDQAEFDQRRVLQLLQIDLAVISDFIQQQKNQPHH